MGYDIEKIRGDFPGLKGLVHGNKPLVYLDNAATTHKPLQMLEAQTRAYETRNANIHRGVHYLSQQATLAHEEARAHIARFINAAEPAEVLFTRGTTEGINMIAATYCPTFMKEGDEVIISHLEHHSNIVPWQMMEDRLGIKLRVVAIREDGTLDLDDYEAAFNERTKLVSIAFASNVMGTINPIAELTEIAHAHGVPIMVDAAQAVAHRKVNVQAQDVDFLAFSGHKLYGPTGIGVLYGKRDWLEQLPPYQGGGEMIERVSFSGTTYNEIPYKYEAGTPDFIGSVALSESIKYVESIGFERIQEHEESLLRYATERLSEVEGLRIYGTAPEKEAVISFLIDGIHPYDLGVLLDQQGVAIRTGHHCAQPLMDRFGIEGTARISFALYNSREEVDIFLKALERATQLLR